MPDRVGNGTGELIVLLIHRHRPRRRPRRRTGRRLPRTMGRGNRKRPAQDPPPRPREGPAVPAARPGPPGDLRLPDRAPRDQRAHREGVRGRRPGPRPHLVRQDPAPDPPHRHRDGGHSPLRTGLTKLPDHLTEIAALLIPDRARTHLSASGQTRPPQQLPSQETRRTRQHPPHPGRPRSRCTASTPAQHDQLTLRGIGLMYIANHALSCPIGDHQFSLTLLPRPLRHTHLAQSRRAVGQVNRRRSATAVWLGSDLLGAHGGGCCDRAKSYILAVELAKFLCPLMWAVVATERFQSRGLFRREVSMPADVGGCCDHQVVGRAA